MSPSASCWAFLTTFRDRGHQTMQIFRSSHLSLIDFKFFTFGLLHCDSNSSNGMVVGTSLDWCVIMRSTLDNNTWSPGKTAKLILFPMSYITWNFGLIHLQRPLIYLVAFVVNAPHPLPVEDQASPGDEAWDEIFSLKGFMTVLPGSSEGLVDCGGDNITVEERRRSHSSSNKTRYMSHVSHQPRALSNNWSTYKVIKLETIQTCWSAMALNLA